MSRGANHSLTIWWFFLRFGDDSSDRFCDDSSLLLVIPPAADSTPSSGSWSPYPVCHTRLSKVLLRHVILGSYVTKGPDPPSLVWLRCYMSEQPLPPSPCSTCLGSSLFLTCMFRLEAEFTSVSWWPSGAAAAVRRRSYVASHPAFLFFFPSSLPSLFLFLPPLACRVYCCCFGSYDTNIFSLPTRPRRPHLRSFRIRLSCHLGDPMLRCHRARP